MQGTLESALTTQARVLGALMLRDMRTRFGRSHWGFLIAVGWPFAHIFIIVGIMVFRGLPTPLGQSVVLFVTTGLVPFIGFMYMSRKIMESILASKPLLFFPQVKSIDILLSRSILEIVIFFASTIMCFALVFVLGVNPFPAYPDQAILALLATISVASGMGSINACIVAFFPAYPMGYVLVIISLYSLSGVFFVPEFLPQQAFEILSWNPMLHCIIWFRSAFYPGYGVAAEKGYVFLCGLALLSIGLLLDRFVVRRLAS
jgi:capsular polysaccharide transport system permease protein